MNPAGIKNNGFAKNIFNDFVGGITSGIIAIPLALAFGVASGLGALAGLYGAIILCFVAAIFGGAKPQISGPTGPMTVIVAAAIVQYPHNPEIIFTIIFLAGIIQIILSMLNVAGMVKYVPYPVISGFMSGIGIIIILLQINPFFGAEVIGSPVKSLFSYAGNIGNYDLQSTFLGILTLAIVFFTPKKIYKIIPAPLIALVAGTLINVIFKFNVDVIGEISSTLPSLVVKPADFIKVGEYLPLALTLGIIGTVDSLLTALVIDSLTKERHNPNKVLLGQGIGNAIAGLFGGAIGAGATMRTVVNIKAGGVTKLSGIIHAVFLAALLLGAAPLVKDVPMTVLAGILIKVAYDIIDVKFIRIIKYAPRHDLYVMILVFLLTVFDNLIFAVGAGITLSALLFARQVSQETKVQVKKVQDREIMEMESEIEHASHHQIHVIHIHGIFFFGSISQVISRVEELLGTKYFILNFESIPLLDISAIFALEDIITKLKAQDIKVLMVLKCKDLENQLKSLRIIDEIEESNVFYDEIEAIENAKTHLKLNVCLQYIEQKANEREKIDLSLSSQNLQYEDENL